MTRQPNSPTDPMPIDVIYSTLKCESAKRSKTFLDMLRHLEAIYKEEQRRADRKAGYVVDRLMESVFNKAYPGTEN